MLLFLSHSGADTAAAVELKRRIMAFPAAKEAGLQVWLDKDELRAGGPPWQTQLSEALEQASAFCVYVGSGGVVNWVEREVQLGLSRATGPGAIPFIPVLAAEARSAMLPPFARQHQAVRDPLGDPEALAELVQAALGRTEDVPLVDEPFVGLRSMDEADAHLFFGREREVQELAGKLRRHPLVAVVADSGAGKSSLVRAGLVPAFRGGILEPEGRLQLEGVARHVMVIRPGGNPAEGLKDGIDKAARALGLPGERRDQLHDRVDLIDASKTARAIWCDLPAETQTLLVVDQFEELLTQAKSEAAESFVKLLLALADPEAARRTKVVLTVRADYFNLISRYSDLFARLTSEEGSAQLRLKRISETGLHQLVLQPLKMAGYQDTADGEALFKAIRTDISDRPGDLALVQMALYAIWRRARQERISLSAAYAQVGGVMGALAHEAEQVFEALSEGERTVLLPLFARLIALGDTGGATRRNVALSDLSEPAQALAAKLASDQGGRLLQTSDTSVEIAHEALITQWPWLQEQIQAHAADIRRLARLTDATRAWEGDERGAHALPNEQDHRWFVALRDRHPTWLSQSEQDFLRQAEAAVQQARRRDLRSRWLLRGAAAVAAVFAIAALVFAWNSSSNAARADANAATADDNAAQAEANSKKAQENAERALASEQRAREAQSEAEQDAWQARRNEAGALAALSTVALRDGRATDAAKLAIAAWPRTRDPPAPQVREAVRALSEALPHMREHMRVEFDLEQVTNGILAQDASRLAVGYDDGTVRAWDLATGRPLPLEGAEGTGNAIWRLALTQDGSRLAVGDGDGTVRAWDLTAGRSLPLEGAEGSGSGVPALALTQDGSRLAVGYDDGTVRAWDLATGRPLPLEGAEGSGSGVPALALTVAQDGSRLAVGDGDGTVRAWDLTAGTPLPLEGAEGSGSGVLALALAVAQDGSRLAVGYDDGTVRAWDLATGRPLPLEGAERTGNAIWRLALTQDGSLLAVGDEDGRVRVWDLTAGTPLPLEGAEGSGSGVLALALAVAQDGSRLVAGDGDGRMWAWDLAVGIRIAPPFEGGAGAVRSLALAADGSRYGVGHEDGRVEVFDLYDSTWQSPWEIACSLLPLVEGQRDIDLENALVGTSIEINEPICGDGYDPPMPWWTVPGATEPQAPGLANDDSPAE